MTKLSDRIDHFVRWFFNSSPDSTPEPPVRPATVNTPVRRPATAKKPKVAERQRATPKRRGAAASNGRGASA